MSPLTFPAHKAIAIIVNEIEHLPQGYGFWHSLPSKGKRSQKVLVKRWADTTLRLLFPAQLRQACLLASLDADGVPDSRSRALYVWLLKVIYRGNAQQLHDDWFVLNQAVQNQPSLLFKPKLPKSIIRPVAMPCKGMFTWHQYPPVEQPTTIV